MSCCPSFSLRHISSLYLFVCCILTYLLHTSFSFTLEGFIELTCIIKEFSFVRLREVDSCNRVHDFDECNICVDCRRYLAPKYASLGHLSDKVDVFNFGILYLEVLSSQQNIDKTRLVEEICLSNWVLHCTAFVKLCIFL